MSEKLVIAVNITGYYVPPSKEGWAVKRVSRIVPRQEAPAPQLELKEDMRGYTTIQSTYRIPCRSWRQKLQETLNLEMMSICES